LESEEPLHYTDHFIGEMLRQTRSIAMVGASPSWSRPSNSVMKYLQEKGYGVIPVNPTVVGQDILGERVYSALAEVPGPVDMIDVFRASHAVAGVVDEAISQKDRLGVRFIWMQIGVRDEEAARRASAAGLEVIMDRCIKIDFARLFGGLNLREVNTRFNSAERPEAHS
jgi:predicted CoA-binding protein